MPRTTLPSLLVPGLLLLASLPLRAGEPAVRDARSLSDRIDQLIDARLEKEGVRPAPVADDAEFFRRLSLDLNGRIPTVAQLRDFLDDTRPDKRRLWIDELLDGRDNAPLYAEHLSHFWRRLLLARAGQQAGAVVGPLEGWVRKQLKANTPYDKFVRGLLTDPEADGFLQANENKPENLAGNSARLFLGVKLECAQCHDDRSGGTWKRQQFWEYAAFFAGLTRPINAGDASILVPTQDEDNGPARIRLPDTRDWVEARFLDGAAPDWTKGRKPRAALAAWVTHRDNPWFARAAANRAWHYLLGTGLIDPVDGLGVKDSPPSHPELLDELAKEFAGHDFDPRFLLRAVTGSKTYQRTSKPTDPRQDDPRLFARAAVRGLSPEQLLDSVGVATGYRVPAGPGGPLGGDTPRAQFLARFDDPHDRPAETQTSIQQALLMMNGKLTEEATSPDKSKTLAAVLAGGTGKPTARRVEELYLATLSRRPTAEESAKVVKFIEAGEAKQTLRDAFWALLNSTEFMVNH
jgi:hypothetical protein